MQRISPHTQCLLAPGERATCRSGRLAGHEEILATVHCMKEEAFSVDASRVIYTVHRLSLVEDPHYLYTLLASRHVFSSHFIGSNGQSPDHQCHSILDKYCRIPAILRYTKLEETPILAKANRVALRLGSYLELTVFPFVFSATIMFPRCFLLGVILSTPTSKKLRSQ